MSPSTPSPTKKKKKKKKNRVVFCVAQITSSSCTNPPWNHVYSTWVITLEWKILAETFPVGEVFSEPHNLTAVNGETYLFAYPNPSTRCIEVAPEPFKIKIEKGLVVDHAPHSPAPYVEMINVRFCNDNQNVTFFGCFWSLTSCCCSWFRALEQEAVVREFGLGLNRASNISKPLNDVTAFERQLGLHFSCGKKHNVFKKPGMKKNTRMHVDLFVAMRKMTIDDRIVFENGDFVV